MEYLLLLVGFVLLVKGADFFVEGSSSLAKIIDRKSTRLNSSHMPKSRMPSSA